MTARVTIAVVLIVLQGSMYALSQTSGGPAATICAAYLFATLAVRLFAKPRPPQGAFDLQWLLTVGVDVAAFSALEFVQVGGIGYTPLFALPVLLSSVLGPMLLAFGTAASVALVLLATAWWTATQTVGETNARFLQAAISGSGFFLMAWLANQLALRLSREEAKARASHSAASMQNTVNQLVIEGLAEGVLVVDEHGTVRSINRATGRLLATSDGARNALFVLSREKAWQPLVALMTHTFLTQRPQESDISLDYPAAGVRRLHVRTRLAQARDGSQENLCVMFLEDLRVMEARLRTEKLAAMGRMSAAVAHEIRNPLAAISQANALLEEDLQDPGHKQLTAMGRQNALRLGRIVDEILNVSRAHESLPTAEAMTLPLDETVRQTTSEWVIHHQAGERVQIGVDARHVAVWFEAEHLRRLMINLLDNALRYASDRVGAIRVETLASSPGQSRLSVWSDGAPLEKTVHTHLFEPFFSSEIRSTGLGLYICRELCERYGALIGYQRVDRNGVAGNEFFVLLRSGAPAPSDQYAAFEALPT
ncbi:MAG: PAS domain-containing sensor histidine kinase [Polaromonas sp.]|nr:PAS domain-containing sensor histidine kinase [Polaromonas sp.]